ncbi:IS30 family transposase [Sphingomonas azotifigens]|uniref:IS30 family transposase n=1 Tax=Sphingomonas azotifigens TaxID=330920 RepID=UPI000A067F33|nr:IS30 family transposase [Sphingomonas azotifigens]
MGEHYRQLSLEERCTIARLREAGQSCRQIAAAVDRPASTIARELKRNSGKTVGYKPVYAEEQARARRWTGSRLERDAGLREKVLGGLAAGWSPEQVAGRLAREAGEPCISHESIYRFVYAQLRRTNDGAWRQYLPRARAKRGWRRKPGGSPASFIRLRTPITERPADAANRQTPGHWEADYMLFARYGHNILVAHERACRVLLLTQPPDRKAAHTAEALGSLIGPWPETLRTTLTIDNGTEFAEHHRLIDQFGIRTFFCDPHAPWQKGGVENAIGRLRRYLPRSTNLDDLGPEQLGAIAARYNNTPRKCLDFKTPAEAWAQHLLHFECESTSRLSPG